MTQGLTRAEMREQAARCGCRGSDEYCMCQNVPDKVTKARWAVTEGEKK